MMGAELKARREALGWSLEQAQTATRLVNSLCYPSALREIEESESPFSYWNVTAVAYAGALADEEARRAPASLVEPVAPSGVASVRWTGTTLHCEMSGLFFAFVADNADVYEWVAKRIRYEQARGAAKAAAVETAQRAVDEARKAEEVAAQERCVAENNHEIAKGHLADAEAALVAAKGAR